MPVYVAFLRAINVGTHNRIAMADLRRALDDAGVGPVQTHLQTGNVVLTSRRRSAAGAEEEVEGALRDALGLDVVTMARTPAALAELAREHPLDAPGTGPKALHVGLLKAEPAEAAARRLDGADFGQDHFELRGRELFLCYPDGMGRSKMTGAFFEKALGVPMTVRSVNVLRHMAGMAPPAG
jgi:uncharacterized protein (DUF1697 family)